MIARIPLLAGCNAVLLSPSGDIALQQRNLIIISTVAKVAVLDQDLLMPAPRGEFKVV